MPKQGVWRFAVAMLAVTTLAFSPVQAMAQPEGSEATSACDGQDAGSVSSLVACGSVTLQGAGGSGVELHVPATASIQLTSCGRGMRYGVPTSDPCALHAASNDPLGGVVLVSRDLRYQFGGDYPAMLLLATLTADSWRTVTNETIVNHGFPSVTEGGLTRAVVPAGTYDLYVIGGRGGASTVTLTIDGLPGAVTAQPMRSAPAFEYVVPDNRLGAAGGNTWSAGHIFDVEGSANLTYYAHIVDAPVNNLYMTGGCIYDAPVQDPEVAFLPGCPDAMLHGTPNASSPPPFVNPTLTGTERAFVLRPAGSWAMGWYHAGLAPLAFVGDIGFAITLE